MTEQMSAVRAEDEHYRLERHAIARTQRQLNKGLLPRLTGAIPCVDCGAPATCYDHRDYRKPDEVEPVCRLCNKRRGPALPGHANWHVHNNWNSLGGGDGEEIELNGRLTIDVDLSLFDDPVKQPDPDWLIASLELSRLKSAKLMSHYSPKYKNVSYGGKRHHFVKTYSPFTKQYSWNIKT